MLLAFYLVVVPCKFWCGYEIIYLVGTVINVCCGYCINYIVELPRFFSIIIFLRGGDTLLDLIDIEWEEYVYTYHTKYVYTNQCYYQWYY